MGEPDVRSASYSSAGWCRALPPGLRWAPRPCTGRPKGEWCARRGLVPPRLQGASDVRRSPSPGRPLVGRAARPLTVARGVRCWALPLPGRLFVEWAASARASRAWAVWARRLSKSPTAPAHCGNGGKASPGGCLVPLLGAPVVRRLPPPQMHAPGAGSRGPLPMCVSHGWADVEARRCLFGVHALWGTCAAGLAVEGFPRARPGVRWQVSGAFPPPEGGQALLPVFPGRGCCGCGDPAPAPQRALLRTGVACCRGGGRASPGRPPGGCLALLRGAFVLPWLRCRPPGRAVGLRCPRAVGAGVRAWGPGTVPMACMPCEGLRAAGVVGGRPGEVIPHCCEGRLVSGVVRPLAPVNGRGQPGPIARGSRARVV